MKVFTFCIYGSNPKYCEGLVRNLETIQKEFPDFHTWIIAGNDVPQSYMDKYNTFKNVNIIKSNETGHRLMCYRFFPIDFPQVDIMFVRDADSRIGHRDKWCINEFIESKYNIFTIRDHPNHGTSIMGGQWGMKKIDGLKITSMYKKYKEQVEVLDAYQVDQTFLRMCIYRFYKDQFIAYVSLTTLIFPIENYKMIGVEKKDNFDFCGNVIDYDSTGKEYYVYTTTGIA